MIGLLRSAFCCGLFLLFALFVSEILITWEKETKDRQQFKWGIQVAELYDDNLREFQEICELVNASAALTKGGKPLWEFGPKLGHSVILPAWFSGSPVELVVWRG
jgi:hypothetical protein